MLTIDFEGTNILLTRPQDMTDEECLPIRAFKGVDYDGFNFLLTAWKPNKEDIEAINAGRPVMLKVIGLGFPPVSLYTYDENFEANQ
jgi:hypothetical protein